MDDVYVYIKLYNQNRYIQSAKQGLDLISMCYLLLSFKQGMINISHHLNIMSFFFYFIFIYLSLLTFITYRSEIKILILQVFTVCACADISLLQHIFIDNNIRYYFHLYHSLLQKNEYCYVPIFEMINESHTRFDKDKV